MTQLYGLWLKLHGFCVQGSFLFLAVALVLISLVLAVIGSCEYNLKDLHFVAALPKRNCELREAVFSCGPQVCLPCALEKDFSIYHDYVLMELLER